MKNIRKRLWKSGHVQQKENYDIISTLTKLSEANFQFLYLFHYNFVVCFLTSAYFLQNGSHLLAKILNWTVTENSRAKTPNANKANYRNNTQERSSSTEMT